MANEFVSREEFDSLKQEVEEIKGQLSLLIKIDKKTDIIFEKLENLEKISDMKNEPLKKDIDKNTEDIKELKENAQWTWRTLVRLYHSYCS